MAFVFQERDLELLGLGKGDARGRALSTLNTFWGTAEISGVALVDMAVWRWMYDHPEATPAELKEAVLSIAKDIWNRFYAPVFGVKDSTILGIYSHMIDSLLYLPDYPWATSSRSRSSGTSRRPGPSGPRSSGWPAREG